MLSQKLIKSKFKVYFLNVFIQCGNRSRSYSRYFSELFVIFPIIHYWRIVISISPERDDFFWYSWSNQFKRLYDIRNWCGRSFQKPSGLLCSINTTLASRLITKPTPWLFIVELPPFRKSTLQTHSSVFYIYHYNKFIFKNLTTSVENTQYSDCPCQFIHLRNSS